VVAPPGTSTVRLVGLQMRIVAGVPLKVTLSANSLPPRFVPAITMDENTAELFGVRLEIRGAGTTVN
jgi:hypothetical protein